MANVDFDDSCAHGKSGVFGDKPWLEPCGVDPDEERKLESEECKWWHKTSQGHLDLYKISVYKLIIKWAKNCTYPELKGKQKIVKTTWLVSNDQPGLEPGGPGKALILESGAFLAPLPP